MSNTLQFLSLFTNLFTNLKTEKSDSLEISFPGPLKSARNVPFTQPQTRQGYYKSVKYLVVSSILILNHTDSVNFPAKKLDGGRSYIFNKSYILLKGSCFK